MKKVPKKVTKKKCTKKSNGKDAVGAARKRAREAVQEMLFTASDAEEFIVRQSLPKFFKTTKPALKSLQDAVIATMDCITRTRPIIDDILEVPTIPSDNSMIHSQPILDMINHVEETLTSRTSTEAVRMFNEIEKDANLLTAKIENALHETTRCLLIAGNEYAMNRSSSRLVSICDDDGRISDDDFREYLHDTYAFREVQIRLRSQGRIRPTFSVK